jgi:predicted Zn-ribbon and HTH transcriptional regulator
MLRQTQLQFDQRNPEGMFGYLKPATNFPLLTSQSTIRRCEHMSQVQVIRTKTVKTGEKRIPASVKHCRSCWRDDFHEDVKMPMFLFGFLVVVTFGIILLVRPSRCVCCGTMRIG